MCRFVRPIGERRSVSGLACQPIGECRSVSGPVCQPTAIQERYKVGVLHQWRDKGAWGPITRMIEARGNYLSRKGALGDYSRRSCIGWDHDNSECHILFLMSL